MAGRKATLGLAGLALAAGLMTGGCGTAGYIKAPSLRAYDRAAVVDNLFVGQVESFWKGASQKTEKIVR